MCSYFIRVASLVLFSGFVVLTACDGNVGSAYFSNGSGPSELFSPCYKSNEPGSTCFNTKEAFEANQRLKIINQRHAAGQMKEPTGTQKKLMGEYFGCAYHFLAFGELERPAFLNCVPQGIALCNGANIPTSREYQISPITGRVALNNDRCGQSMESWFNVAIKNFDDEFENYSRSEAAGVAYQPLLFDLRKYAGQ